MNKILKASALIIITALAVAGLLYFWQLSPLRKVTAEMEKENNRLEQNLNILKHEYACAQTKSKPTTWNHITFELPSCWSMKEANLQSGKTLILSLDAFPNVFLEMTVQDDFVAPKDQAPPEIKIGNHYYYLALAGPAPNEQWLETFILEKPPYLLNASTVNSSDMMILQILGSIQFIK